MKLNQQKKEIFWKMKKLAVVLLPTLVVLLFVIVPGVLIAQEADALGEVNRLQPAPGSGSAQRNLTSQLDPNLNPNSSAFKIVVCDGPTLPDKLLQEENAKRGSGNPYVACDFNGMMLLVQHLINIMMVIGVLVAIVMFSYAGYLYITGKEANISKAHDIFPKVLWGFIIMLSAWFIVYQILSWLTKEGSGFSALLGKP